MSRAAHVPEHVRHQLRALLDRRAQLIDEGYASTDAAVPVWEMAAVLVSAGVIVPDAQGAFAEQVLDLTSAPYSVVTVSDALGRVRPASAADEWSRCRDHHRAVLVGESLEAVVGDCPDVPAVSGDMTGLAGRVMGVVERHTGIEWPAALTPLLETALDVMGGAAFQRPSSCTAAPLRWMRGETTDHRGSSDGEGPIRRRPVRDELVGRGINPETARRLTDLLCGRPSLDDAYGYASSSAVFAAIDGVERDHAEVPLPIVRRWAVSVLAAAYPGQWSDLARSRTLRVIKRHRRASDCILSVLAKPAHLLRPPDRRPLPRPTSAPVGAPLCASVHRVPRTAVWRRAVTHVMARALFDIAETRRPGGGGVLDLVPDTESGSWPRSGGGIHPALLMERSTRRARAGPVMVRPPPDASGGVSVTVAATCVDGG